MWSSPWAHPGLLHELTWSGGCKRIRFDFIWRHRSSSCYRIGLTFAGCKGRSNLKLMQLSTLLQLSSSIPDTVWHHTRPLFFVQPPPTVDKCPPGCTSPLPGGKDLAPAKVPLKVAKSKLFPLTHHVYPPRSKVTWCNGKSLIWWLRVTAGARSRTMILGREEKCVKIDMRALPWLCARACCINTGFIHPHRLRTKLIGCGEPCNLLQKQPQD